MDASAREPLLARAARRGRGHRARPAAAVAVSIALHCAVVFAAVRIHWSARDIPQAEPSTVVWLAELPLETATRTASLIVPEQPQPSPAPEPPEPVPAPLESTPAPTEDTSPGDDEPMPAAADEVVPAPAAEANSVEREELEPATADSTDEDEAQSAETGSGRSRAYIVRDVDWEEERRRAVAGIREQTEREDGYLTFSLDDVIERPLPEEPGTARSVFDTPKRGGPAIMRPGRSGTRLGRFVSSLCDITGGISLFGVATACADSNVPRDLFESIKPEYLKKRPAELAARPAAGQDMQNLADVQPGRDMQDLADVDAGQDIQDAGGLQDTAAGLQDP